MQEVMRCALLCILEAAEGGLCSLEVLEVLEVSEVMHCVLFCLMEVLEVLEGARGDAPCAALYGGDPRG